MIKPEDINAARMIERKKYILSQVDKWYWEGEKGFIDLVESNQSPGMVVVEIGCYDGSTTRKYIDTVKKNNGHVIIIDTFMGTNVTEESRKISPGIDSSPHAYGLHNLDLYDVFLAKFKDYEDMMTVHKGFSHECIPLLPENCDIIFIDADHTYEPCKKDIELSIPKVKKGGILCGHDCESFAQVNNFPPEALNCDMWNNVHAGVVQAVYDLFGITKQNGVVWYTTIE